MLDLEYTVDSTRLCKCCLVQELWRSAALTTRD